MSVTAPEGLFLFFTHLSLLSSSLGYNVAAYNVWRDYCTISRPKAESAYGCVLPLQTTVEDAVDL